MPADALVVWARTCSIEALVRVMARAPLRSEVYALQGVTCLESNWGQAWRSPPHSKAMTTSHNTGCVQCTEHYKGNTTMFPVGSKRPDLSGAPNDGVVVPGHCALAVDSRPLKSGGNQWYTAPYRIYADPVEAFVHTARILLRMNVIGMGGVSSVQLTVRAVSTRMYDKGYYQGTKGREGAIDDHVAALTRACLRIAKGMGESQPGLSFTLDPLPSDPVMLPPEPPGPVLPGPPVISEKETLDARILLAFEETLEEAEDESRKERDRLIAAKDW